ncbi:hypothetical protein NCCP2716_08130 [Sporosarcina sp. NCCP-2716]|uniref:FapA family protein n=1 Tax=Sporosarcina sp. NCCP-2716 TaxID=2943679 RepID=UPI002041D948|nr:FapA family protein [Sporosarcina sp. NCCP-2716]GKV68315.1 hypothetical protein NCCP2716_08130 [Sporosarcina sp. NCCP-2716]
MGKAITVRGKTVEQAVEAALGILGLGLSDVRIHVTQTAETQESPARTRLAEVVVTPVRYQAASGGRADRPAGTHGICITSGRADVQTVPGAPLPVIEAGEGVQVIVNGRKTDGGTPVSESDSVHIRTIDELTRAQLSITIREQGALALLSVTPGRKITRTVKDTPYADHLRVETEETAETVNDLSQQMIREACSQLGVTAALDKRVLWEACETTVPYEGIIARGTFPKAGLDGDIEVQIDVDGGTLAEEETRIDYREKTAVRFVQAGQLVAAVLPPVPGQSGEDIFGNEIPAEDGKPADILLGRNVARTGNHLFADCPGKLSILRKDGCISIEIADTIALDEVDLASGNVRFDGDVTVAGSVTQGCAVDVTGKAVIGKDVRKSAVKAGRGILVSGHVSSSRLEAGIRQSGDAMYAERLSSILPGLQSLRTVIITIARLRQAEAAELEGQEVKKLIRTVLGDRYDTFLEELQPFLSLKAEGVHPKWQELQMNLYHLFVHTLHAGVEDGQQFLGFLQSAEQLYDQYRAKTELEPAELTLPYAVNSQLVCSGSIHVTEQGLAQCTVHAKRDLRVDGICRGGELTGERSVSIKECGSKRGVQTVVRTGREGAIVIGIAFPGTVLYVGEETHQVAELLIGITARLENGVLIVR